MYLILSVERPSTDILTGKIKANFPTRNTFSLPSEKDSIVVLDKPGAEKLIGNGDMLYKTIGQYDPIRFQGAFISNEEIQNVINYIKNDSYKEG